MLLVQLGVNNTRDVWKFCQIGLALAARPILAKFPNITRTINPQLYSPTHDYLYKFEKVKTTQKESFWGQISWPPLIKQINNSIIYKNVRILLQKYMHSSCICAITTHRCNIL